LKKALQSIHNIEKKIRSLENHKLKLFNCFNILICVPRFLGWQYQGIELREDLALAREVLYHLSNTSGPVCFRLFSDRVLCFFPSQPTTTILLPMPSA
jgi:hypothetical protein